jgi:hypothetical protein
MDAKNTLHPQLSYIRRLVEHRTRDVFRGAASFPSGKGLRCLWAMGQRVWRS